MNLRFWKKLIKNQIKFVLGVYETNARLKSENSREIYKWQACGAAAEKMLQELQMLPTFDAIDTINKARVCFELGLQPMISAWHIERGADKSEDAVRLSYSKAQGLIDELRWTLTQDSIDLYLYFDWELRSYLSTRDYSGDAYAGMFHLRYSECMSIDSVINMQRLGVSVETWDQFLEDCRGYGSMTLGTEGTTDFLNVLNDSIDYMLQKFDILEQSEIGHRIS